MDPNDAYAKLRVAIPARTDLRYQIWPRIQAFEWALKDNAAGVCRYKNFCYIATQVFCHLVDGAIPFCDKNRSHFWAQVGETIYDPTADQFDYPYPYDQGRRTKFPNGLSKRSASLLETVLSL